MARAPATWDWRERARRVDDAQARVSSSFDAFKRAGRTQAARQVWDGCCAALVNAWQEAWPPGFWTAFESVGRPGPCDVALLVSFLEAGPVFFRSGYVTESILRRIGRAPLDEPLKDRLRAVLLDAVARRHRREFRRWTRLARVLDTPELRRKLVELARGESGPVRRHATWVLDSLAQADRMRSKPALTGRSPSHPTCAATARTRRRS